MARFLALGLAAAVLPACHENKIWVMNEGTNVALVKIHYTTQEDHDDDEDTMTRTIHHYDEWSVAPGAADGRIYGADPIEIDIYRAPDGVLLFHDWLYYGDFRDDHSRIELTVYP